MDLPIYSRLLPHNNPHNHQHNPHPQRLLPPGPRRPIPSNPAHDRTNGIVLPPIGLAGGYTRLLPPRLRLLPHHEPRTLPRSNHNSQQRPRRLHSSKQSRRPGLNSYTQLSQLQLPLRYPLRLRNTRYGPCRKALGHGSHYQFRGTRSMETYKGAAKQRGNGKYADFES